MKITVCFGDTKIIVPCGDGNIRVFDIIDNAITRFNKATCNKYQLLNATHIRLKTKRDDGLLDPDDILSHVVEDKEILIAINENEQSSHLFDFNTHNNDTDNDSYDSLKNNQNQHHHHHHVLVTQNHLTDKNNLLKVKSESLNNLIDKQQVSMLNQMNTNCGGGGSKTLDKRPSLNQAPNSARSTFSRTSSNRQSKLLQNDHHTQNTLITSRHKHTQSETFIFQQLNTPGVLGIHVIPTYDINSQRDMGLIIQRIEPNGRIAKEARLKVGDRIVEINERSLIGVDFVSCQQLLRNALQDEYLRLRIVRESDNPLACQTQSLENKHEQEIEIQVCANQGEDEEQTSDKENNQQQQQMTTTFEQQKHQQQLLVSPSYFNNSKFNLNSVNTKKIGKKISVQLVKGPQGLGFKLAARDNPTGEISPIYIKNILPRGAAITDGRLQRGDRLLSVNNIDMTVKTLHEAVGILRDTKLGSTVDILVSRQVISSLPRELPPEEQDQNQVDRNHDHDVNLQRELLTFEIALNDTGSAGLGVSVKGKTKRIEENESTIDLGIFVKTVINGGAASKDGRLKPNDQLININGFSLLGKSNEEAMHILREAMQVEIKSGYIQLTVSRKTKHLQHQQHTSDLSPLKCYQSNDCLDSPDYMLNDNDTENENNIYLKRAFNRDAPTRRSVSEKRKLYSSQRDNEFLNRMKINRSCDNQSSVDFKRAGSFESVVGRPHFKKKEQDQASNGITHQTITLNRRFTQVSHDTNGESSDEKRSVDELRRNYLKMVEAQHNQLTIKSKPPLNNQQPTTVQIKHQQDTNGSSKLLASCNNGDSFNNKSGDSEAPLTNILNRQRAINRSFRTAVDKSFDVPITSSEASEELNGRLSAAGLTDTSRANHLRMSSQSDDSRKSKKSKKSFIETFQNLFKTTKRDQKSNVELLNYNRNENSNDKETLNNTNEQHRTHFPSSFQLIQNGEPQQANFYARTILNSSSRNNGSKNTNTNSFNRATNNFTNNDNNNDLLNLPKPAQV